ncbi:MAG: histidine kinase [bacterium]|nr:histidine kinase [bacterium]
MVFSTGTGEASPALFDINKKRHHRQLMRRTFLHLLSLYFLPLLLLTVYFHIQTLNLREEGRQGHLQSMAEYQAHMLDLFIRERVINLTNLINSPELEIPPTQGSMRSCLDDLHRASETFVDLEIFNARGDQVAYAGPFPVREQRNYSNERWFEVLSTGEQEFVITDIYLGFRQRPHFTMAVRSGVDGDSVVLRATLEPDRMYDFITSTVGAKDLHTSIVNRDGVYQVVTPNVGSPLAESSLVPPETPSLGVEHVEIDDRAVVYGYAWLMEAGWALITQDRPQESDGREFLEDFKIAIVALPVFVIIFLVTYFRAKNIVRIEEERDQTKLQLVHSAKLASVGELAGGIAHEINNPLAIISEEAGLMGDLINPEFGDGRITLEDMVPRLERIQKAVFRCRDITRKLLGFVRQTEYRLAEHDLTKLLDQVVDDFFLHEMGLSNIEVSRHYDPDLPLLITDANQLEQVCVNLLNNAADAIEGPGRIDIGVIRRENAVRIAIRDSGSGMNEEQMQRIFTPFFTTKETGKGTGLGLSVSSGIVEGLGGVIEVESESGSGSTFTIVLPL